MAPINSMNTALCEAMLRRDYRCKGMMGSLREEHASVHMAA
jgi:hypothetical protein